MKNILNLNSVGTPCDFNECESNPCHNGECEDGPDKYTCKCTAGYEGITQYVYMIFNHEPVHSLIMCEQYFLKHIIRVDL